MSIRGTVYGALPTRKCCKGNSLGLTDIGFEKAGVGGSTPSLATMFSITYLFAFPQLGPFWLQLEPVSLTIFASDKLLSLLTARCCDSGTKLLVDVERRAGPGVPHLRLRILNIRAGHLQPGGVRVRRHATVDS